MYTNNPYAQAGWANPANPHSVNNGAWAPGAPPPPSIFGALPGSPPRGAQATFVFRFTGFAPTILNCTVVGPAPRPRTHLHVATDRGGARTTACDAAGAAVATVEWGAHPHVEIHGVVPRQTTAQWLAVGPDQRTRRMEFRRQHYIWFAQDGIVTLYTAGSGSSPPEAMGRISVDPHGGDIVLELTAPALQAGLLEPAAVATLLFRCGKNID